MNSFEMIRLLAFVLFAACIVSSAAAPIWERLTPTRRHARGRRLLAPDEQCAAELWNLDHRLTQVVHPVDLQGHWVSSECEIHPGPKYVLRDYQFYKNGNFLIRHYEYKDEACTNPLYGFTANGNVLHLSKSWAVPGGTDSTFSLTQTTVVPYTKAAAKALTSSLRRTCRLESGKQFEWPWLEEYRAYVIFNSPAEEDEANSDLGASLSAADQSENDADIPAEMDCLHSANFTMIHLSLLRMDEVMDVQADASAATTAAGGGGRNTDEYFLRQLYFGKPIWDSKNTTYFRPSSFQSPLVDVDQMPNCKTCQRIRGANPLSPPRLKPDSQIFDKQQSEQLVAEQSDLALHQLPILSPAIDYMDGDWISTRCESYEHGMYAHRRMSFSTAAESWQLRQRYYNDPLCKHASFTLLAEGHYFTTTDGDNGHHQRDDEEDDDTLSGSQRLSYKIERVRVVPESRATVHNLRRAENCGPANRWRQGRATDVSPYGGCAPLGILVPAVTKDIVKVVVDDGGRGGGRGRASDAENRRWLFTGDYAAVEYSGRAYPTSYQSPMVKCAEMTVVVSLDTSSSSKSEIDLSAIGAGQSPEERYGINFSRWQASHGSRPNGMPTVGLVLLQIASFVIWSRIAR